MSDFQFLDILIFALIAAFLVFRLRSVLGRRTGNEKPPARDPFRPREPEGRDEDKVVELPNRPAPRPAAEASASDDPLESGIMRIKLADSSFEPGEFAAGARLAFEMVVEGFGRGDTEALRPLLSSDVFESFKSAIEERKSRGHTAETKVVGVRSADILEARLDGRTAFVTIKFVSEQINVTRDEDGAVVEGDPAHIADVTDIWTFARNTRSRDPNWALVETRSPQ